MTMIFLVDVNLTFTTKDANFRKMKGRKDLEDSYVLVVLDGCHWNTG